MPQQQALDPVGEFFDLRHGAWRGGWETRNCRRRTCLQCALLVPVPAFSRHS